MWSTPEAKCDGESYTQMRNYFRYPKGVIPGNVIHHPGESEEQDDSSFWFFIILIFQTILGIVALLVFLFIGLYFALCCLRLFYLDTLKPYKTRTLKSLGKYRSHRHHIEAGPNKKVTLSKLKDINGNLYEQNGNGDQLPVAKSSLNHPLGKKISFTSPPTHAEPGTSKSEGKSHPPRVLDYLKLDEDNDELPPLSSAKKKFNKAGKRNPSRIPMPKKESSWKPNWYQKEEVEEDEAKTALDRLQSLQSRVRERKRRFKKSSPEVSPPPTATAPPLPENQIIDPSLPKTPSRPFPGKPFTQIPGQEKKTYKEQLMVVRAGPRRQKAEIDEIRKKRKSESKEIEKKKKDGKNDGLNKV